jgi:hypothetical protein
MSFGRAQDTTSQTNLWFIAGVGVATGLVLLITLGEAKECARWHSLYRRALKAKGAEREQAREFLQLARYGDCRWARRIKTEDL